MAKIYAGSANYVAKATTKVIHAAPGKLRAVILSGDGTGTVTFYDNTTATGAILMVLDVLANQTREIFFDNLMPVVFTVGLSIITSTNARCFVITEA